jgi:deoxyribodipyrimidine photo-lyase
MTASHVTLIWFRDDLRIADNPALHDAVSRGASVLCLYVFDEETPGLRPLGGAARWWLAGSLRALRDSLRDKGADLVLLRGDARALVPRVARKAGASHVVWSRRYGAAEQAVDTAIKAELRAGGVDASSVNSHLLNEPWTVSSKAGEPLKVFTPFWRAALAKGGPDVPLPAPSRIKGAAWPAELDGLRLEIDALALEPRAPDWAGSMRAAWSRGEAGARERLEHFVGHNMAGYAEGRNRPDLPSTSKLSPHLRFGEISIRQCWHAAVQAQASGESTASGADVETFLKELGWREFSYYLLHSNPDLARRNYARRFDAFPWRENPDALKAWQSGRTGYPIVDAGMRELYATGWMHNRVRMIVASFLIKHLLLDWRRGEEWFWDTLVDADPASNAASWQWVAGTGADSAPFFRIFNPIIQGEKFDPDGGYVRRWVPELARIPNSLLHKPWTASTHLLEAAGVLLGQSYPRPIIEHEMARDRALAAFQALRRGAS